MFNLSVYALVTIPLKKGQKTGTNNHIDAKIPSSDLKTVDAQRSKCMDQLDKFRKNAESVRGLDNFLSTEDDREKYVTAVVSAAETYVGAVIDLVTRCPKFGIVRYYMWTSSLCEKQEIAFDDYRYELSCVYYDVAAILLNIAQYVLCVRASVGTMAVMEKEAYRILLRAAGYFSTAGTIVASIKQEPIGAAQVPVPIDTATRVLSFLETVSLAQAQEIGTNRAVDVDAKGDQPTTARLCHQTFVLYQNAKDTAQGVTTRCCQDFVDVATLVSVKYDVYKALMYNYAASSTLASKPSDALWFMGRADQHAQTVAGYKPKKMKLAFGGEKLLESCLTTIRRNSERIAKINSLVHRVKPSSGTVSLPAPQVLAQKTEMRLPAPLPPPSASVSQPPEQLTSEETK